MMIITMAMSTVLVALKQSLVGVQTKVIRYKTIKIF